MTSSSSTTSVTLKRQKKRATQSANWPRISRSNSSKLYTGLVAAYMSESGLDATPVGQHLLGAIRSGSYHTAVALADSITEQCYGSAEEHFKWNQLAFLVKKMPFKDPKLTPEQTAIKKFFAAEHACKRTNQRFRALVKHGPSYRDSHSWEVLWRARELVYRVLGENPPLETIYPLCDFGPGASVLVHGNSTSIADKLKAKRWSCTPGAAPYAVSALANNTQVWGFLLGAPYCLDIGPFRACVEQRIHYVRHNKITFVPKSAKTHRSIAIEPLLNGFIQKGVDEFLKITLKRLGVDLQDQSRNQRMARIGSLEAFNPLVTIDLAAASDSLAIELVRFLLPPPWFDFLNAIRSPHYKIGEVEGRYEKFTSMGNGFCFPLETLIFWAIATTCNTETGDTVVSVYGDDIIVPQRSALLVIQSLRFAGFKTNVDKTFVHGPFRESCGKDFFSGIDVRPLVVDSFPESVSDLYVILNGLRNRGLSSTWNWLLSQIPPKWHLLRPAVVSSGLTKLLYSTTVASWSTKWRTHQLSDSTAIDVDYDTFMASRSARWNRSEQRWVWRELIQVPVGDDRGITCPSLHMLGLLRGSPSGDNGLPVYHYRRKTSTRLRWVEGVLPPM